MKNKSNGKMEFDSFKEPGKERASTNQRKEITDWEVTDLIQFIDEHTNTDEDFQHEFTHAIFKEFGWKFYTKIELEEHKPIVTDEEIITYGDKKLKDGYSHFGDDEEDNT